MMIPPIGHMPHVSPGAQIDLSAGTMNTMIDVCRAVQGQRKYTAKPPKRSTVRPAGTVLLRNDSGTDRAQYEVLGLGAAVFAPSISTANDNLAAFAESMAFAGETPTAEHGNRFAILNVPIKSGEFGTATIAGSTLARVTMVDESHRYAALVAEGTVLQSCSSGPVELLWVEPEDDRLNEWAWALVRIGGTAGFFARITGSEIIEDRRVWRYSWDEVAISADEDVVVVEGGRSGTTSTAYAINACELDDTAAMPVPVDAIVWLMPCEVLDDAGEWQPRYVFERLVDSRILARITGSAQVGTARQWRYAWNEVRIGDDFGLVDVEGGLSGTTSTNFALNVIELLNVADGAGTQGNSVKEDRADFPDGFDLQPVGGSDGVDVIVELRPYLTAGESPVLLWLFSYENAHDGVC